MIHRSRPVTATIPFLLLVAAWGCDSHGHSHDGDEHEQDHDHAEQAESDHDEGHAHAEGAIGITRWSETLELFAEHPPAVAGRSVAFLAHLTVLDGFRPLEEGTVTLALEGPERIEAQATEPVRSGIYRPTFTADRPGTYRGTVSVKGPDFEGQVDGFEIVVHPDARSAEQAAPANDEEDASAISFLKEQQWKVPFDTASATETSVVPSVEVGGEVTTPPNGQAVIGAPIAGRLVPPRRGLPRPGQEVRRGELLATIAPAPAAPEEGARAELAVAEAEARVTAARAAVERAERLIADRAIPQRQVDEAHRELKVAKEALQSARRARELFSGATSGRGGGTYRITAPIDGVVASVEATAGESVSGGDPLFRVVDSSELWIRARVPEQQAPRIRRDQNASFRVAGMDDWLPLDVTGEDPPASVVDVGRTVDPRSRTVDVIYGLHEADDRLRIGAMARVNVPAGEPWEGVAVPRDAVIEHEGRTVVYVQTGGETFEERTVRIGPRSGRRAGIERGVEAGERVVVRGANLVRLSAHASQSTGHGHVH